MASISFSLDIFSNNMNQCYNLSEYTANEKTVHLFCEHCQWIQCIPGKTTNNFILLQSTIKNYGL